MTNRTTRAIGALALFALLAAGSATAQVGQQTMLFLQIEPDSRAAGMGNANTAIADNATAVFWNPGGLAFQRGAQASFTHAPWLPALGADLFFEYLNGMYHVEGLGTVGGHITFFNLGEQIQTDEVGNNLGTFRSYEIAAGLALGRQVGEKLGLGLGLRYVYSNLAGGVELTDGSATQAAQAFAFDLGALYKIGTYDVGGTKLTPSLGFNLANMGNRVAYVDDPNASLNSIPTNLKLGLGLNMELDEFNSVNFAADFGKAIVDTECVDDPPNPDTGEVEGCTLEAKPFYQALFSTWQTVESNLYAGLENDEEAQIEDVSLLQQFTVGVGAEYWYADLFAMRAGYFYEDPRNGNRAFLTLGAGIRYSIVGVDLSYIYGIDENSPLSDTIRFSLLLNVAQ
jgi:hypothetical protein